MSLGPGLTVVVGSHAAALMRFWLLPKSRSWDPTTRSVVGCAHDILTELSTHRSVVLVCDGHWPSSEELDALLPPDDIPRRLVATDYGRLGAQSGVRSSHRCAAASAALADAARWSSMYLVCGTWWTDAGDPSVVVRENFDSGVLPELGLPGSRSVEIDGTLDAIASLASEQPKKKLTLHSTASDPVRRSSLSRGLVGLGHHKIQWFCARKGFGGFVAGSRLEHTKATRAAWVSSWHPS